MQCTPSPGCNPVECEDFGGNTCDDSLNQFQIVNHHTVSGSKVKTGNIVLLRSIKTNTHWLDCSDHTQCVLSPCNEDNPEDPGNSSYISNCSKHHFTVLGLGRPLHKLLSTKHKLQFKYGDSGFLNCNGKRCEILPEGDCPNPASMKVLVEPNEDGVCPVDSFFVTKLSEI